MEDIKQLLLDIYGKHSSVEGLVLLHNTDKFPFHSNEYLYYLLVVTTEQYANKVEHIEILTERVFVRTVKRSEMEGPSNSFKRFRLMEWLFSGEILFDKSDELQQIKKQIIAFPHELRGKKRFIEFNGYLETLLAAKKNMAEGNLLDAYSQILQSLHHWAQIVLIEEGIHPELTVWKQIRKVHPGIYKLFEELVASPETLEQRIQLVMLACEFSVMSKMKECCQYLLEIMSTRQEPWSIGDLQSHRDIQPYIDDISLIIHKLVQRQHVKEVPILCDDEDETILELKYVLSNK